MEPIEAEGRRRSNVVEALPTSLLNRRPRPPLSSAAREGILASAANAFDLAVAGINEMKLGLGDDFVEAVVTLERVRGRIILTGMGKSGHVARKIAATLSSTGSPAFFVHPGEASHGDLGMIGRDDAVVALSNSGETAELMNVIEYTRRFGIPLIAITKSRESTLGEKADITLVLPSTPEACPNGQAPTTSTTMTLALGDAIAMALLNRRSFSAEDFKVFHPGGALGKRVRIVRDIMRRGENLLLFNTDVLMETAIIKMTEMRAGCVGIVNEKGDLIGAITDGDIRRSMSADLLSLKVSEVMTPDPVTIRHDALAAEALFVMKERGISAVFVRQGERLVGLADIHDLLAAGL
ncbi:SIS domain-containing protein [Zavarzinia sp.]|uniref:KpsF/GutQ family sugar-phosphate isomerase n=1 Tax=Zavarzinia sp. TaxID=2027920 RepID=UPI00356198FE